MRWFNFPNSETKARQTETLTGGKLHGGGQASADCPIFKTA
jgi:hypothetical protein